MSNKEIENIKNIVLEQGEKYEGNKLLFYLRKIYHKYEKILAVFVFLFIILLGIYGFDYTEDPRHIKFNYNVANYHTIDRFLNYSNEYSTFIKKDTKLSWFFRYKLMKEYVRIKQEFPSDFYNSVGLFYSLMNDFKILCQFYEENELLSNEEKQQYLDYKEMFLSEMHTLLMEYRQRNKSIKNFIYLGHSREYLMYMIPNRISFYPELAAFYYAFKYRELEADEKILEDLKYIYETFDVICNQENELNGINVRTFDRVRFYKRQFDTFYPLFILDYTRGILAISKVLHPEVDVCKTSNICEKYAKIISQRVTNSNKNLR